MTRTAIQHSARFDADIEYNPSEPCSLNIDDEDHEVLTYWGIDADGNCYFITFVGGIYNDSFTEEA